MCALCADPAGGALVGVGCADGWVRVFDRRDSPSPPPGVSVHASDGWAFRPAAAAQVHVGGSAAHVSMLADSGGLSVVCASAAGSVRRCDLRAGGPFEEQATVRMCRRSPRTRRPPSSRRGRASSASRSTTSTTARASR